jgi:hypothetical protein
VRGGLQRLSYHPVVIRAARALGRRWGVCKHYYCWSRKIEHLIRRAGRTTPAEI